MKLAYDALNALHFDDALEALDKEFFMYPDDLTELLVAFVSKHPDTFGPVS